MTGQARYHRRADVADIGGCCSEGVLVVEIARPQNIIELLWLLGAWHKRVFGESRCSEIDDS